MDPVIVQLRYEDWVGNYPVKVEQLVLGDHQCNRPGCERCRRVDFVDEKPVDGQVAHRQEDGVARVAGQGERPSVNTGVVALCKYQLYGHCVGRAGCKRRLRWRQWYRNQWRRMRRWRVGR